MVDLLLSIGASLNASDLSGNTPLHCAVRNRRTEVAVLLLSKRTDVNVPGSHRHLPLYIASQIGILVVVKLLIEAGANIEMKDYYGETPLQGSSLWSY